MAKGKGRFYRAAGPVLTNNNAPLFRENFSEPCGLPFGSHSVELGKSAGSGLMDSVEAPDLYKGVEQGLKGDHVGVRSLTKPHRW